MSVLSDPEPDEAEAVADADAEVEVEVCDVVVVGSGNAGFSAALAAKEHDRALNVVLLEKAPESWAGGNSTFTAGAYRTVFHGLHEDLLPLVSNVSEGDELVSKIDITPYTEEDFLNDLKRVTNGRTDPALARELVRESNETTKWLARHAGVDFQLSFNRQAYQIDGRFKFWGGMVLSVVDGGKGLIKNLRASASREGIEVRYENHVCALTKKKKKKRAHDLAISGVRVRRADGSVYELEARGGVILCAGGFEANPALRAQYLGPGWDKAYVRGTPYNTGDLLKVAMDQADAKAVGHWSGCHSTCWDANAPTDAGDQVLTNQFTKSGYPLGLMINLEGERFVDEGLDLRNYTYAKFGREILKQPDGFCFQVWDADGARWLRKEEYGDDVVEKIQADSIAELAQKLSEGSRGLRNTDAFVATINNYNAAVRAHRAANPDLKFDPSRKDGLSTHFASASASTSTISTTRSSGVKPDKTNWALPIAKPPFLAVKVTCGITFTFGGLKIDPKTAGVISNSSSLLSASDSAGVIPGLYCAGEMVGGLFYDNYPGGSGLTSGAVFGRKAGSAAAQRALQDHHTRQ